jgi:hypothetical protein
VNRAPLIAAARELNPSLRILVRARYLRERRELELAGATAACFEETEAAVALARELLHEIGTDSATIERETNAIRRELSLARTLGCDTRQGADHLPVAWSSSAVSAARSSSSRCAW